MDRYHSLGPKQKVRSNSLQDALVMIRRVWPNADFEGSAGFERSSAIIDEDGQWLVAHTWQSRAGQWYVRIADHERRIAI